MTSLDPVRAYLELGLRLGRHADGLVDSYFGPAEIAGAVDAEPLRPPAELAADAARLHDELPEDEAYLRAQVLALATVARRLDGEEIPYAEEVERCYGVVPERVPEEVFEAALGGLDAVLPGTGSLAERWDAWREGITLEGERLERFVEGAAADLRERTAAKLGLPEGEAVHFEMVGNKPWAAFNYYEGGLRSRVAVNVDLPMPASRALHVVSHETYPGHHTEHAWKEQVFVRERGRLEETIVLIGTPHSLISEGIAEVGPGILLGDEYEQVAAEHLARVGVEQDPDLARAVAAVTGTFESVNTNAALLVHEDGASWEDARDYMMRWRLASEPRAAKMADFITDPLWRSYVATYDYGERLVEAWTGGDPSRFRRLLTEQLTTADLL